jgi:hypothetical protein
MFWAAGNRDAAVIYDYIWITFKQVLNDGHTCMHTESGNMQASSRTECYIYRGLLLRSSTTDVKLYTPTIGNYFGT